MAHVHESPAVMLVPLIVLAIGAAFSGMGFHAQFIGGGWHEFWRTAIVNGPANHVLADLERVPESIALLPTVMGALGIALAYGMYVAAPSLPGALARAFGPIYRFLLNKWYFDELYDAVFVRPALALARSLWQVGDATLIDGVPNGLASLATDSSAQVVKLQTGSIAIYAFSMLIGLVLLVTIYLLFR